MVAVLSVTVGWNCVASAEGNVIYVDASEVKCKSSPDLWGIFVEEIGGAVTGGLYAEMISNPSFEQTLPGFANRLTRTMPASWSLVGDADARSDDSMPLSKNNRWCVRVDSLPGGGIANSGYDGIFVEKGKSYRLSMNVRGKINGVLSFSLERFGAGAVGEGKIENIDSGWQKKLLTFTAIDTAADCRVVLRASGGGVFYLDNVSLFPEDTYGKSGIFRKDLMERLAALKPSILRFPGG